MAERNPPGCFSAASHYTNHSIHNEKNRYGRITVGLLRTTFLIDEQGCVERIFTPGQIRTKIHAEQILKAVAPKD